ncbi:MAG: alpha/beta hydrolase [Myxococcota bacterium]|nr:alpha/beta hydrolase [Myxococcota bacterium]
MVEPSARFEEVRIPLEESVRDLDTVSGVLGVPEWWPTGSRIGLVLAHGSARDMDDPVIEALHRGLTERKYLTLRFNFPFAESKKKRPDALPVLERTCRSAVATLGRDPTAAPAHLFVGGIGLGGMVAAQAAAARLRVDGVFMLGYPLHGRDDPTKSLRADPLFRLVSPMLFVQGTRDRHCDLDTLRTTLQRVGAPKTLQVVQEADATFTVPKRSGRTPEDVLQEVLEAIDRWCRRVLGLAQP